MNKISDTDLILNKDGSVYHLNLLPEDVANTIITVGDPERVADISKYFDQVEIKKSKREFVTHTGRIGTKRFTVISTGIGTDNIDIVLNELDALVNVNLTTRVPYPTLRSLDIIRIGTSGAIQADIPVDSLLISSAAFGLDPLMHYYEYELSHTEKELLEAFNSIFPASYNFSPYIASADKCLLKSIGANITHGITITAPGFYAAQGRQVRAISKTPDLLKQLQKFSYGGQHITNLEMETAGIYGLAASLGHKAISFNVILANRITQIFSKDPVKVMDNCINELLKRLTATF